MRAHHFAAAHIRHILRICAPHLRASGKETRDATALATRTQLHYRTRTRAPQRTHLPHCYLAPAAYAGHRAACLRCTRLPPRVPRTHTRVCTCAARYAHAPRTVLPKWAGGPRVPLRARARAAARGVARGFARTLPATGANTRNCRAFAIPRRALHAPRALHLARVHLRPRCCPHRLRSCRVPYTSKASGAAHLFMPTLHLLAS